MDDENPPRVSRKNGTHEAPRAGPTRKGRHTTDIDDGDQIKCSGKHCRACTAGLVADCVALCCCPFAVVEFLALALVKVPWMVGRRCLGLGRKKGQRPEMKRKCKRSEGDCVVERDGNVRKRREVEGIPEIASGFDVEEIMDSGSARFEAERVWLELYQVGHLGFGRVSFTGIQISG
ncbi:uncharacterized protein LOC121248762 [Juglans microcarpa x Juglans regia]|uniref:uncharacterized protein LOC121248762 n=1 Tax=Juglans microcarpa x Juglans regia TaxID=2249226 RepID=UPI001B7F155C|nr:uncharacterized protein LOC121248762 [Juglans microcarpa x Juglans regia]